MSGVNASFGPSDPAPTAGPPFAVAGPSALVLDGARAGMVSFTVSNVTGRPVRVRTFALPGAGADAGWFTVVGESERSLPVDGTAAFDVQVAAAAAAAGSYAFALGAALEEAPDQVVSGPTVAFEVKPKPTRRFPWWIVIVAVAALLVVVGGIALILWLNRPQDPVSEQPPVIVGTAEVGQTLTVTPGVWDRDDIATTYVWQRCPETPTAQADGGCATIELPADTAAMGPPDAHVVGSDDIGSRLRVVEVVAVIPDDATSDADPLHASASSVATDTVPTPPVEMVEVIDTEGLGYLEASGILQGQGLQVSVENTDTTSDVCDPTVLVQVPPGGTTLAVGSVVTIVTDRLPHECLVFVFNPDWVIDLPFDDFG